MSSRLAPDPTLRPVTDADRELLLRIYASTRAEELSAVAWPPGQLEAFMRMQFDAQDSDWRDRRPNAAFSIVKVDGQAAGRLYVDLQEDEVRIVDISLLPEFRGLGIGTALLRPILDDAEQRGVPVTIHVERGNRARGFYERLGFRPISTTGVYDLLQRTEPA